MQEFLTTKLLGIPVKSILIVLSCVLVALVFDWLLQRINRKIITRQEKRIQECREQGVPIAKGLRFSHILFRSIDKPLHWFLVTVGVSLGLMIMKTPDGMDDLFKRISQILSSLTLWYVVWFLLRVTEQITSLMVEHAKTTDSKLDDMLIPIVSGVAKVFILAMGVIGVLQCFEYQITTLVTYLGISSAAIALAAKDTLANIFGALVVFFDKPFEVGDWVTINGVEGEVEEIRLRVTTIRTFDNTLVMMPNSVLSNTNINNWQRRKCRKIDCSFGVLYSTTAEQLENIVKDVRTFINTTPAIFGKEPKFYVNLNNFGDSSFDIQVVAYSIAKTWVQQLQDKQDFMLAIIKIVEKNGTGFAFPTRTLDVPSNTPIHVKMEN